MATYPEQVFQNNMVHHPLLQYQMLFPAYLMSLGARTTTDEDDPLVEGSVNTIDYLRFSSLANQLAITQINQVLMDIVTETPGDDLKKLTEMQMSFMELFRKGLTQMHQEMSASKTLITSSNDLIQKQEVAMTTLEDKVIAGFLNSSSEMVDMQGVLKNLNNQTSLDAKEVQEMVQSVAGNVKKIQDAINALAKESAVCCSNNNKKSSVSEEMLNTIQHELLNLTRKLTDFIASAEETAVERATMMNLIETWLNASSSSSSKGDDIDMNNITKTIEKGLADNLRDVQPQVKNLTEDVQKFDSSLQETQKELKDMHATLAANMSKSEADLQFLRELTIKGFVALHSKIDEVLNASRQAVIVEVSPTEAPIVCPEEFFSVEEDCFFISEDNTTVSFSEAEQKCKDMDAYLGEPKSWLKFLATVGSLNLNRTLDVWMGGQGDVINENQSLHENEGYQEPVWQWVNSGKLIDHGWNLNFPLPYSGQTMCLYLYKYGFQSSECDEVRGFVCESFT